MIKKIKNMILILLFCVSIAHSQIKLETPKKQVSIPDHVKTIEEDIKTFIDEESYKKRLWQDDKTKLPIKYDDLSKIEQKMFILWQYESAGYKLFFYEAVAPSIFEDAKKQEEVIKIILDMRKNHAIKFEKRIEDLLSNDVSLEEKISYLNRIKIYHDKYKLIERKK